MRAWLYYRLSNDDDPAQNSLLNQRKICQEYASKRGYVTVGESSDDNVSGMNFQRPGLNRLAEAAECGNLDIVVVKDLSRLGRHKTQTALFIDFLRERGIRVLSATEGLDTFAENDDLVIGVRGLMNDYYARDMSKKIRAGYRQKQKEGLIVIPPFGYRKDKNTDSIKIVEEAAETVRRIYQLYLEGVTLMPISRILNQEQRKTPAQMQAAFYGKHSPNVRQYLWSYTSVKNVLQDESYIGVLYNHQQEVKDGKCLRYVPVKEQFRHEQMYPPIISQEDWQQAQALLRERCRKRTNSNTPSHRYAGLLACGDCGAPFVAINRYWNGKCRVEYICKTYMRHGKGTCASHRIREEMLDQIVQDDMSRRRDAAAQELVKIDQLQKRRALKEPVLHARRLSLEKRVAELEQEIDDILMEKIQCKS
jgi:DNA invertase Pin-like site-specific DNA recombinase